MANVFRQFLLDAENGDVDGVKRNIENGIDLETRDEDQQTALILSARCNHLECVKVLLEARADVDAEDVDNWTALLNASQNGNLDIVHILVEHDAKIEHFDCGQFTPLMWASYEGHTRIVEYLLSCDAKVDAVDEHGISSLSWASGRNHVDIVELLLKAGASPSLCDKNDTTPLIWASRRGHTEIVDLLLKYNATVNNIGMKNMTALLAATRGGHGDTALRLLQNQTIDIKVQDKDGHTPLSHACAQGLTDVVAELVRHHAYVNTVDRNGDPVLFFAVKGGKEDCVAILLDNHADINAIGADNKTAIWWAVERGRLDVVKYLLQFNPDVEVVGGEDDDTPLLLAAKRKRVAIVYELIKYGARLSATDRYGDNSLHIALRNRSRDIADILLSNPRHSKYLYRPNKRGETPYKIDANLQKSILTTIFGQRTLNLNDDSILGYDLYSSALAEILSEPSLRTPITVGLYAKWGSGKSALLTHLKDEMHSFAQLTDFPTMEFSPLLLSVIIIVALVIGLIIGFSIHYIVGISLGVTLIMICIGFLVFIRYLLRHKDYIWTANVAQYIKKRLEILRFLLQVLFMNPYVHHRSKKNNTSDYKKMKFIFTEYGKVSTVESEKASASMIAELATNVEETFGIVATRLCRALHSKDLSRHRFRYICCMPTFIFISIQISLLLAFGILVLIYGVPSSYHSVNITYISLISILGASILLSFGTCLQLLVGLMKSPKSKIMKLSDHSSRLNESSLYRLKKEVSQLSYIIKSVEAFLNINTRLVVLIDGLDVCEQQRILQILDQVHVLLTKENDPFITLIVCDPHKMMQDLSTTLAISSTTGQNQNFDTNVNGHDYLRSIIQLPIYLQLNMSKTKQLKKDADAFPKKRSNTLTNGGSVLDIRANPVTTNKLPKNKRRRQRRDTLSNIKPVTTSELTNQLLQSDYFLDINPRILQRLINIIAMTGRLLRANQVLFSWKRLGCWSYLVEQWPYRISWIVVYYEDHEQEYSDDTALKALFDKIKPFIPTSNDHLVELDRNGRKFELCIDRGEPILNIYDLKQFLLCTCNLDPYLNKLIRDSAAYFYMNNSDENGFISGDTSRFFSHDPTDFYYCHCMKCLAGHGNFFQQGPISRHKNKFHPRFSFAGQDGNQRRPSFDFPFHRLYNQVPIKKRADDEDSHHRTSSVSSASAPILSSLINQKLSAPTDSSGNVKVDLSPPLSQMSVNDICDCLKNDIIGLKTAMIPMYIHDINEYNISGRVLATCDLSELKRVLSMTFGDWVLFNNWIDTKREEERRSHFRHHQSQPSSILNTNHNQNLSNNESFNEYQLYTENSILGAALNRLMSQNPTNNSMDETRTVPNENLSIVSAPKNVKFLIPLVRSGITSNESTFGGMESTTRNIRHVKDIFSLNSLSQSQPLTTINNNRDIVNVPSSLNLMTTSSFLDEEEHHSDENEIMTSDGDREVLFQNKDFNQK
ncbi:unnamed protein product [Rotaria sordida]|uniref:KAP NTPase domain-containing protein n=1 Tax=Rotaria sordida TaxID=392033 RepID=A0A813RDD3_9BILA|nr:unnamed protein product [Rotaria sordida]CAF3874309.1 unnamed protein product [Rotaria sordida]